MVEMFWSNDSHLLVCFESITKKESLVLMLQLCWPWTEADRRRERKSTLLTVP